MPSTSTWAAPVGFKTFARQGPTGCSRLLLASHRLCCCPLDFGGLFCRVASPGSSFMRIPLAKPFGRGFHALSTTGTRSWQSSSIVPVVVCRRSIPASRARLGVAAASWFLNVIRRKFDGHGFRRPETGPCHV